MSQLRVGSRLRLWPKDTYAKYGIVREINANYILVELTEKDPRDHCRHQVGDIIKLPSRGLQVLNEKEFKERYC
ncbi:hypothetical protein [Desulforamulus aeronauticus]|uniref:Uncharacterized protein n=1 Tax=Desulforamulus aeronauticus DSM 10349 TaxID=1121421 RepID=A0A1M6QVY4_9FIRM|nr:hypothetical protein [Desulforamulus aeronauticus]SHK24248.1 hypothetical protein SAMN02745123_01233 [Desulforamulus aeronauticus DSM 10349]